MIVYLVRHGESAGSAADIFQKDDDPLSQKGKVEVNILARSLRRLKIDGFYSSPFERAKETAEIISKTIGKPFEVWDTLVEARNPKELDGKSLADSEVARIRGLIKDNYFSGNWKYSDEETFEEIKSRGKKVVQNLLKRPNNEVILCVSHARIIKMIVTLMVFSDMITPEIYWNFKYHMHLDRAGLIKCKYTPSHGWWVKNWNITKN